MHKLLVPKCEQCSMTSYLDDIIFRNCAFAPGAVVKFAQGIVRGEIDPRIKDFDADSKKNKLSLTFDGKKLFEHQFDIGKLEGKKERAFPVVWATLSGSC